MNIRIFVYSTDDSRFEDFKNHKYHKKFTVVRIKDVGTVAEAYNGIPDDVLADYNLWLHDDVRLLDDLDTAMPLIEHLFDENKNSIIGVAGAKQYGRHIAWWDKANDVCGKVTHTKDKLQWTSEFGPLLKEYKGYKYDEVQVVDGLFMLMPKQFYVDRRPFNYAKSNHFYDIRASFTTDQCYVIDFPVLHYSMGELTEGYAEEAQRLVNDYGGKRRE